MDNIGMTIRKYLGADGRVELIMKDGTHTRMVPIDAREVIEGRHGKIVGPVVTPTPPIIKKPEPDMSEDEIVERLEEARTEPFKPQPRDFPFKPPKPPRASPEVKRTTPEKADA